MNRLKMGLHPHPSAKEWPDGKDAAGRVNFRKITRLGDTVTSKVAVIPQQSYFIPVDDGPEEIGNEELEEVFNSFEQIATEYASHGIVDLNPLISLQFRPHQFLWAAGQWFATTSWEQWMERLLETSFELECGIVDTLIGLTRSRQRRLIIRW